MELTLQARLQRSWSVEEAFTTPVGVKRNKVSMKQEMEAKGFEFYENSVRSLGVSLFIQITRYLLCGFLDVITSIERKNLSSTINP